MATITLGTSATDSLTAVVYSGTPAVLSDADLATIAQGILSQGNVTHPPAASIGQGGFVREGLLYLPDNRGVVKIEPGDYVGLDVASGWPILVSAYAIQTGPWTHS